MGVPIQAFQAKREVEEMQWLGSLVKLFQAAWYACEQCKDNIIPLAM
jgi:16S rRNA U1498 N3-methylase RsmE